MAFMLWQRLANQNQLSEVGEHLESTSKMLSSVSQELKSRDAKEAVERLQNTMQDAQRRALMHVFNRWSCVSASLHENETRSHDHRSAIKTRPAYERKAQIHR